VPDRIFSVPRKGLKITVGKNAEAKNGNVLPLGEVPIGTSVCNIEIQPSRGGQMVRASGLTATVISKSQINLSWTNDVAGASGVYIERKTGTGSWLQIATVGSGVSTYSNTGLSANTSYSYQVRAYNATGNSGYSNTVTAKTKAN